MRKEFKDRKVYNIETSVLKPKEIHYNEAQPQEEVSASKDQILLFTTATCPNCKMADSMLTKAHVDFEKVDAEAHAELSQKFNIRQAPTLVVLHDGNVEKYANASNIKKYIQERS